MQKISRVDENQPEIVKALRQAGATVQSLAAVGKGCPDLLVAYRGQNYLVEVKDGNKPPSARQLTPDQQKWHSTWGSPVHVVKNTAEALNVIGIEKTVDGIE